MVDPTGERGRFVGASGGRLTMPLLYGGRSIGSSPVEGGSCNDYEYVCADPVNDMGLIGAQVKGMGSHLRSYCLPRYPKKCWTAGKTLRYRASEQLLKYKKKFGWDAGQTNAFRHAYWMAMIAKRYGKSWAVGFGKAYEGDNPRSCDDSAVDFANNPIGAAYGVAHKEETDGAIGSGIAWMVQRRSGDLNYSSTCG